MNGIIQHSLLNIRLNKTGKLRPQVGDIATQSHDLQQNSTYKSGMFCLSLPKKCLLICYPFERAIPTKQSFD